MEISRIENAIYWQFSICEEVPEKTAYTLHHTVLAEYTPMDSGWNTSISL